MCLLLIGLQVVARLDHRKMRLANQSDDYMELDPFPKYSTIAGIGMYSLMHTLCNDAMHASSLIVYSATEVEVSAHFRALVFILVVCFLVRHYGKEQMVCTSSVVILYIIMGGTCVFSHSESTLVLQG